MGECGPLAAFLDAPDQFVMIDAIIVGSRRLGSMNGSAGLAAMTLAATGCVGLSVMRSN